MPTKPVHPQSGYSRIQKITTITATIATDTTTTAATTTTAHIYLSFHSPRTTTSDAALRNAANRRGRLGVAHDLPQVHQRVETGRLVLEGERVTAIVS